MTSLIFFMSQVFEPWLTTNHHGHKSHLSLEIAESFLYERQILLIALNPNSTHLLQPLDVSVFKSLKSLWSTAKNKWKAADPLENITETTFPKVFLGFQKTGLYPLYQEKVDYSKCVKDQQVHETDFRCRVVVANRWLCCAAFKDWSSFLGRTHWV